MSLSVRLSISSFLGPSGRPTWGVLDVELADWVEVSGLRLFDSLPDLVHAIERDVGLPAADRADLLRLARGVEPAIVVWREGGGS